jgi:PAS domain-containing protein
MNEKSGMNMELRNVQDQIEQLDTVQSTAVQSSFEPFRKRFQAIESHVIPAMTIDAEGTIQHISLAARRLLEYPKEAEIDECFFTHVHGKNLYRVMQDIAHMVCFRLKQASWLLRMRTGRGRYRWYKATVKNRLNDAVERIVIKLETV